MHTFADKKLLMLKPDDIIVNPNQPRKNFDTYELQSLADSISTNGIIQPLTVRKGEVSAYSGRTPTARRKNSRAAPHTLCFA